MLAHKTFKINRKDHTEANPFNNKENTDFLLNLKADNNIIISRPDKGKGVVIMDKADYNRKVNEILKDHSKFKLLTSEVFTHILKLEDKLNRLLRSIKDKVLDKQTYDWLFASGSQPGILYGLPKIHKLGTPIRPILSAIGTFNYNCAKFLVPLLSPLTTNSFTIKNSISFAKEINSLEINPNFVLASFDVTSLFTNIPLDETISICLNQLFVNDDDEFNKFSRSQFKSLLELSVKESAFIFNDKLYKQVDGVAMGSPLGPTFANAFLCFHEQQTVRFLRCSTTQVM